MKDFIEKLDVIEFSDFIFFDDRFYEGIITVLSNTEFYLWKDGDGCLIENPMQYKNIKEYAEKYCNCIPQTCI